MLASYYPSASFLRCNTTTKSIIGKPASNLFSSMAQKSSWTVIISLQVKSVPSTSKREIQDVSFPQRSKDTASAKNPTLAVQVCRITHTSNNHYLGWWWASRLAATSLWRVSSKVQVLILNLQGVIPAAIILQASA